MNRRHTDKANGPHVADQVHMMGRSLKMTRDLEDAYVAQLDAFMHVSKKLEQTTKTLDAVSQSLSEITSSELENVQRSRARIQSSVSAVRNDFVAQIDSMLKNPNYSDDMKRKLARVLDDFKKIDERTRPGSLVGGAARRRKQRGGSQFNAEDGRRSIPYIL